MKTPKIVTPPWIRQGISEDEWRKQNIKNRLFEILQDKEKVNKSMKILDKKISISPLRGADN